MGFGTVGLGQTESAEVERNRTAVFSRTGTTDNQSEDPRLHRHFFSFLCNCSLLTKGRGIAWIFLSTKPAYMLCNAGKFSGLKFPQIALHHQGVQSAIYPVHLAGNQKPRTTTLLDTTRTTQLPDKITVLKSRSPRHFPGPRVAGVSNDWCITFS